MAALPIDQVQVISEQEAEWPPEQLWMVWEKEKTRGSCTQGLQPNKNYQSDSEFDFFQNFW
jgi:hypothetical protein